jgi:predicted DNA binding CopG/RHH family protein
MKTNKGLVKVKIKEGDTSPMTKCTIRIPLNIVQDAKIRAIQEGHTFQEVVNLALNLYLFRPIRKRGV